MAKLRRFSPEVRDQDPRLIIAARSAICALLLLTGCGPGEIDELSGPSIDHTRLQPVSVRGRLFSSEEAFGLPADMLLLDDSTMVVIDLSQPFVHLVRRSDGTAFKSLGRRGQGPTEFLHATGLARSAVTQSEFWVHDQTQHMLKRIRIGNSGAFVDSTLMFRLPPEVVRATTFVWLGDSAFVALARGGMRAALVTYNPRSQLVTVAGSQMDLPMPEPDSVNPLARRQLNAEIRGCYESSNHSYARIHRYASRVDIVSAADGQAQSVATPFSWNAEVTWDPYQRRHQFYKESHLRRGYISCAASPDHLLALFSGRQLGSFTLLEGQRAGFVHIFAWDGSLVKVLELDEPVTSIAYDPKTRQLYGARYHPDATIWVFDLNGIEW